MSKKLRRGLAGVLAIAALVVVPAVAQATPKFYVNGVLAGEAKSGVTQFGKLVMSNSFAGEFTCTILVGVPVWNEGGVGHAVFEGWEPYLCSHKAGSAVKECPGAFVTAENAIELSEKENSKSEKEYAAIRGTSSLPWQGEVGEPESGVRSLTYTNIRILFNCPSQGLELPFEGTLEPHLVNGAKNGLHPSHLKYEGKGGKTGHLTTFDLPEKNEENVLNVSGELTLLGSGGQELITAE